jgi:hypothetical protein
MATVQHMTAQEYLANPDETVRSELVEGEVIVQEPNATHQIVLRDLFVALYAWAQAAPGRGDVSWTLDVLYPRERALRLPPVAADPARHSTSRLNLARRTRLARRCCPASGCASAD